jgi:hypothetical protein
LEQGLHLEVEIQFRSRPQNLSKGTNKLNSFCRDASLELLLVDVKTRTPITVRPYNPTRGMPVQDQGKEVELLDDRSLKPWPASFPLATVWSTLKPGTYEARIRFSFPGGYQKWWWRGTPQEWDSFWKEVVTSGPATLTILPASQKTETYLLPKRLRLLPGLKIAYTKEDAEKVEVPVRPGFYVGTMISRGGAAQGMTLMGGTPKPADVNPVDQIIDYRGGDRKSTYTIEIFETADAAEHMWHPRPGSGDYRVLWKKTLTLELTEKEIRKVAGM